MQSLRTSILTTANPAMDHWFSNPLFSVNIGTIHCVLVTDLGPQWQKKQLKTVFKNFRLLSQNKLGKPNNKLPTDLTELHWFPVP